MTVAHFFLSALFILLIDLLLGGDNALVIALTVRRLPARERRIASLLGAALAVVMRVVFSAFGAAAIGYFSSLPLTFAGGLFIAWIALKVLIDVSAPPEATPSPRGLLNAIWQVGLADLTMSVDNILAIAGASKGNLGLILFGLGMSIPFVVFSANLLARLMDRFPLLIYLGAAILGKVAADMIITDPFVVRLLDPSATARVVFQAALIVGLLVAGKLICARRRC
jgi:YjbE family integral membrane protein